MNISIGNLPPKGGSLLTRIKDIEVGSSHQAGLHKIIDCNVLNIGIDFLLKLRCEHALECEFKDICHHATLHSSTYYCENCCGDKKSRCVQYSITV